MSGRSLGREFLELWEIDKEAIQAGQTRARLLSNLSRRHTDDDPKLSSPSDVSIWTQYERILVSFQKQQHGGHKHDLFTKQMIHTASNPSVTEVDSIASVPTTALTFVCQDELDQLSEICWSRLHTGPSGSVAPIWRKLYERTQIMASLCLQMESGADSSDSFHQAIRYLDLALMMGSNEERVTRLIHGLIQESEGRFLPSISASTSPLSTKPLSTAIKRSRELAATENPLIEEDDQPPETKFRKLSDTQSSEATISANVTPSTLSSIPSLPTSSCAQPIRRLHLPSMMRFQTEFMTPSQPVILTGVMDAWPAYSEKKWTNMDYFKRIAGHRTVPVELGADYLASDWTQSLMTLSEFIDNYIEKKNNDVSPTQSSVTDQLSSSPTSISSPTQLKPSTAGPTSSSSIGYLAQHALFNQIPALRSDILIPDYCLLGTTDPVLNAWIGPSGTVSRLHHDPTHNLLAQVRGRKYLRLVNEKYSDRLYPNQEGGILSNTSRIDIEHLDTVQFPLAVDVPYFECILEPGEMLYIPPRCWHYVRALDVSCSVSFWWE